MKYRIDVKRKDINNGKCGDPRFCAVALAFDRRFGKRKDYAGVEVSEHSVELWLYPDDPITVALPKKTTNFIYDFDDNGKRIEARKKMKPFSFMVNV